MPKAAALIALALTLITGLVIGNLTSLVPAGQSTGAISPEGDATSRIAMEFYDAIDRFLQSGDVSPLRRTVHPDYIDHSSLSDEPGTIEGFETWLAAIRASAPGLRFAVSEIIARDGLIAVELAQTGTPPRATLAGLSLTLPAASSGYELLRIEDNLVIERWASPELPGLIEPSVASLDGLIRTGLIRTSLLERLTFDKRASLSVPSHKGMVLLVESGTFTLRNLEPAAMDSEKLVPGAIRAIPPDTKLNVWNTGPGSATLVALTIVQVDASGLYETTPTAEGLEIGITRQLLAGATIRPDHGPFQLQIGHAVVPPGTTIPRHQVNELEMLFVTEGMVEARIDDGYVFALADFGDLKTEDDTVTIGPDQAISATFNTDLSYTVTGTAPAELWLITVMPEE